MSAETQEDTLCNVRGTAPSPTKTSGGLHKNNRQIQGWRRRKSHQTTSNTIMQQHHTRGAAGRALKITSWAKIPELHLGVHPDSAILLSGQGGCQGIFPFKRKRLLFKIGSMTHEWSNLQPVYLMSMNLRVSARQLFSAVRQCVVGAVCGNRGVHRLPRQGPWQTNI